MRIKDIYSIPCATYSNGKKAIRVDDNWAYVQYCDGMRIFRYHPEDDYWYLYNEIVQTNF